MTWGFPRNSGKWRNAILCDGLRISRNSEVHDLLQASSHMKAAERFIQGVACALPLQCCRGRIKGFALVYIMLNRGKKESRP